MRKEKSIRLRRADLPRPPTLRSRATNGRRLFAEGGDERGPWARRLRDVFALHLSDLGGPDNVSEAERSIVRRAAVLTCVLEGLEAKFAVGESADRTIETYQRTANSLRRLLESVGLKRRPRDVQTLESYLAENYGLEETATGAPEARLAISLASATETPLSELPAEADRSFNSGA